MRIRWDYFEKVKIPDKFARYLEKSFSFEKMSIKVRKNFNVQKLEKLKGIKKASDYDIFLNKIYSAGRRIDSKDPFDAAFLYKTYKWNKKETLLKLL